MNEARENAKDRIQRYRVEARECREAAKTTDLAVRPCLTQYAQLCEILADGLEATLDDDAMPNSN
jgi:hypothetical protein